MQCNCQYCGKPFATKYNCSRHEGKCVNNPSLNHLNGLECSYCGKVCKNVNSLRNHERLCPSNPNRHYESHTIGRSAWNKGLTKETDYRIKKYGETYASRVKSGEIIISMAGKHHTEESKKKMSESHKKLWLNGESIFATAREHRASYPEEYFSHIFLDAKRNYHVSRYLLDFAWPAKKVYIEVDGEQHYTEKGLQHDNERTAILSNLGWVCIIRIRWKEFNKLTSDEKKHYIDDVFAKLNMDNSK